MASQQDDVQILHPLCYGSFATRFLPHLHSLISIARTSQLLLVSQRCSLSLPLGLAHSVPLLDVLFAFFLTESQRLHYHSSYPRLQLEGLLLFKGYNHGRETLSVGYLPRALRNK